jgi:hypothetical protein
VRAVITPPTNIFVKRQNYSSVTLLSFESAVFTINLLYNDNNGKSLKQAKTHNYAAKFADINLLLQTLVE